jgi:hypothetical protein
MSVQLRSIPSPPRRFLAKDPLTTGGFECPDLRGAILVFGSDSGIADHHCANLSPIEWLVQYVYARLRTSKTA